jgi:hypothetical protein
MHDTLRGGHFSLEEPAVSGGFRDQLPGESRVRFPGMAAYYTINQVRYPQLEQHRQARRQLVESRDREIWAYLRSNR